MALLQDFVICKICNGKQSRPRRLKCQHTFCESCLARYISRFVGKSCMPCPSCAFKIKPKDSNTSITPDIANSFEEDGFTSAIVDALEKRIRCETHTEQTIIYVCLNCGVKVCEICSQSFHRNCPTILISDKDALNTETRLKRQKSDFEIERLSNEIETVKEAIAPKIVAVQKDNLETKEKVKEYYSNLKRIITQYLTTQEMKVINHLHHLVEDEVTHYKDDIQICTSMKASLAERQEVVSSFDKPFSENALQNLMVTTRFLKHLQEVDDTLKLIVSDTNMEFNLRFMINTELEEFLQELDLVQIELLSSCHTPAFSAFNNTLSPAHSPRNEENHTRDGQASVNYHLLRSPNQAKGRSQSQSSVYGGDDTGIRARVESNSPRRSVSPRDELGAERNRDLQNYNQDTRYRDRHLPKVSNPRKRDRMTPNVEPPPTYQGFLDRKSSVRRLRNSRFPAPSAPPLPDDLRLPSPNRRSTSPSSYNSVVGLSNDIPDGQVSNAQDLPVIGNRGNRASCTGPVTGFIPPCDLNVLIQPPIAKVQNFKAQTILSNTACAGEKRDARIIGIASLERYFVIADKWNNSIKVISHDYKQLVDTLPLKDYQPWDIATINECKCVVTAPRESALLYVGFYTSSQRKIQVLGTLKVSKKYACVAYLSSSDRLVCGVCPPHGPPGIDILSSAGILLRAFSNDAFGNKFFKYPRNISVTDKENIIICDFDAKRVVFINPDNGAFKVCQLSQGEQMVNLQAVCVNFEYKIVLIADCKKNTLFIVSYSGDLLQTFTDVLINRDPKRIASDKNRLAVAHGDGSVSFYTMQIQ